MNKTSGVRHQPGFKAKVALPAQHNKNEG